MNGLVQCGKVFVAESSDKGVGAFAACAIRKGEVVSYISVYRKKCQCLNADQLKNANSAQRGCGG